MPDSWYDTAQICINGHMINSQSTTRPERMMNFCNMCGASTITNCQNCGASIRGTLHAPHKPILTNVTLFPVPDFCHECGKPYPWMEVKIAAAHELAEEMENLSGSEKELLRKSIDDLVTDSPRTELAVTRFKKILLKVGEPAALALRNLVVDIASETAKKLILGR